MFPEDVSVMYQPYVSQQQRTGSPKKWNSAVIVGSSHIPCSVHTCSFGVFLGVLKFAPYGPSYSRNVLVEYFCSQLLYA